MYKNDLFEPFGRSQKYKNKNYHVIKKIYVALWLHKEQQSKREGEREIFFSERKM